MSAYDLYHTWKRAVREVLPGENCARVRNVAWMIVGLCLGQSVHLSAIARKLPLPAKLNSTIDRFRRLLNNRAFRAREWYQPIAEKLLSDAARCGKVRLLLDSTKVGAGHQLLMVALAYRHRALPIAWTWVKGARGHSTTIKQVSLLKYIHSLVPIDAQVELVGDCEFGRVDLARQADAWQWSYALRQKGNTRVCILQTALAWCRLGSLVTQRDKLIWYDHALITFKHLYHARLAVYWDRKEKEPWLLMTNFIDGRSALKAYRRRMWIEEMFGDWKGHGVDIEKTHLRYHARLSRLVFLVALWYLWLVARGTQTIKAGDRALVDRLDRRDLSVFRIGLYIIDRYMAQARLFAVRLAPYF